MEALWLKILVYVPLGSLAASVWVSDWVRRRMALVSGIVSTAAAIGIWVGTQPINAVIPPAVMEMTWFPGIPVEFALGLSGLGVPFLLISQLVLLVVTWQNLKREAPGAYFLLALQLATTLIFTSLDLILFCAAVELFFMLLFLLGKLESNDAETISRSAALHLLAGALWIGGAVTLGMLHQEQFQVFSTRMGPLRDLVGIEFGEVLFWVFTIATLLRAPLAPLHYWITPLAAQKGASRTLSLALAVPIAIYSFTFWILPVMGEAFSYCSSSLAIWSAASLFYCAIAAWATSDLGRWTGLVSAAQASLAILGIALMRPDGFVGSLLLACAWPLIVCGWTQMLDWLEAEQGARDRDDVASLFPIAPRAAWISALLLLCAGALPGTGLFASVLLITTASWATSPVLTMFVGLALLCFAFALIQVVQALLVGRSSLQGVKKIQDLAWPKTLLILGCIAVCLWIGINPGAWRARWEPALKNLWKTRLEAQLPAQEGSRS